jgi:hypothetical protein
LGPGKLGQGGGHIAHSLTSHSSSSNLDSSSSQAGPARRCCRPEAMDCMHKGSLVAGSQVGATKAKLGLSESHPCAHGPQSVDGRASSELVATPLTRFDLFVACLTSHRVGWPFFLFSLPPSKTGGEGEGRLGSWLYPKNFEFLAPLLPRRGLCMHDTSELSFLFARCLALPPSAASLGDRPPHPR